MSTRALELLTSVADYADGGRGEDEDPFPQQCKLPQHHDVLPEKLDELGHAAGRVGDLQGERTNGFRCVDAAATAARAVQTFHPQQCALPLSHLHLWVHTAVDGGDTPGRAGGDQTLSCRGKHGLLVLVEGLQRRVLARALQLVPK